MSATSYSVSRARYFVAGKDYANGTVSIPQASVGSTRTFVRLWDADASTPSGGKSTLQGGMWQRGEIIRGAQPIFVLTSLGPMLDPSLPAGAQRANV